MKRTPLTRRTALKSGKPLKAKKPLRSRTKLAAKAKLDQGAPLKRGGRLETKTRLRQVGARKRRERPEERFFREAVLERSGGWCERCGTRPAEGELEAHHVVPRGRAAGHERLHWHENGAALCHRCHRAVHGARELEDRDAWLKPARALDDVEPGQRLAEVDPSLALAILEARTGTGPNHPNP